METKHSTTSAGPPPMSALFPKWGVSIKFLIHFLNSPKMKQPMHELAGFTRAEIDTQDLLTLRTICREYRVLATDGMTDTLEFAIYDGTETKPKEYFVDALCQLPTTMAHVCFCIVKPETKKLNGSYAEKIILKGLHPEWVGKPTDFCSHVWKSSFKDFVESLVAEDNERQKSRLGRMGTEQKTSASASDGSETRYYWNDVFVIDENQTDKFPKEYFYTTFRDAVGSIGRTLLVMGSLKNAKPLTRAWCIWEIFCTIDSGGELAIVMPPAARMELKTMLLDDFDEVIKIIMGVKTQNSKAFSEYDLKEIHRIVRETCKGGFNGVDGAVCAGLSEWLGNTAMKFVDMESEDKGMLRLMNRVATLLQQQGKRDEAEPLFRRCLAVREKLLGAEHPSTLISINNLAVLLKQQGKLDEAEPLYRRCLAVREKLLGAEHPSTLLSMYNLAFFLQKKGVLDEAEIMARRSLEGYASRGLKADVKDGVRQLGGILRAQKKDEEADELEQRYNK
jgi:tetratricopeptide (TPR) repeat protein